MFIVYTTDYKFRAWLTGSELAKYKIDTKVGGPVRPGRSPGFVRKALTLADDATIIKLGQPTPHQLLDGFIRDEWL